MRLQIGSEVMVDTHGWAGAGTVEDFDAVTGLYFVRGHKCWAGWYRDSEVW